MKILMAGDTHANRFWFGQLADVCDEQECDLIFVVGDFGYWPQRPTLDKFVPRVSQQMFWRGKRTVFIDGNHEDHDSLARDIARSTSRSPEGFIELAPGVFYAPRGHRWSWEGYTFLALGGAYCVHPDSRILMQDLSWQHAGDLCEGDEVVGFDEDLRSRHGRVMALRPSVVESTHRRALPCVRVVTDVGECTVSTDHLFVWRPYDGWRRQWQSAAELNEGESILWTTSPWEPLESRDAGYLAGLFDGEGWMDNFRIHFAQRPGPVLDEGLRILKDFGFRPSPMARTGGTSDVMRVSVLGGKWENLRLLGSVRPRRLLAASRKLWADRQLSGANNKTYSPSCAWARVLRVEFVGTREVVAMQTSTRTFIHDGFAAHNSIDRHKKGKGWSWFEQEVISHEDVERAKEGGRVDVMVTHDCPAGMDPPNLRAREKEYFPASVDNRNLLRDVVTAVRPRLLIHGHWHERYTDVLALPYKDEAGHLAWHETRVEGLNRDNRPGSWEVLDFQRVGTKV